MSTSLDVGTKILEANDRLALENRNLFDSHAVLVVDLLSSPGSGKTTTILALIKELGERYKIGVIEGDIASDVDAQTIKESGCPAVQINTGGLCHLESNMIKKALTKFDLDELDLIIIENVGNLVCPVDFDLGEDLKCMILSVPEGDDKPLKYPGVFQAARALIVNKIDTLPAFDFDMQAFEDEVQRLNPQAPIFKISALKTDGVSELANWLAEKIETKKKAAEH